MCLGEYLNDEAIICVNNVYTLFFKLNFLHDIFASLKMSILFPNTPIRIQFSFSIQVLRILLSQLQFSIRLHLQLNHLKFGLIDIYAYNVAIIPYALSCLLVAMHKENHLFEYGNVQFLAKVYL